MGMVIFSGFGLPFMALTFFVVLEAAFTERGIWIVLSDAGLDLCRISIGIVGALFLDIQIRSMAATFAVSVLLLNLILTAFAMLVSRRALSLKITQEWIKAFSIVGIGILSMVIPAVLLALNGVTHTDGK